MIYPGKATVATRAVIPSPPSACVCNVFHFYLLSSMENNFSPKPFFWATWRLGDAVVSRGNAGWTTPKSRHLDQCQNCSWWWPPLEDWKRISAESSLVSLWQSSWSTDRTERGNSYLLCHGSQAGKLPLLRHWLPMPRALSCTQPEAHQLDTLFPSHLREAPDQVSSPIRLQDKARDWHWIPLGVS